MDEPAISSHGMRVSDPTLLGAAALFFAASAVTMVVGCDDMSAMGEMRMPGGWTMSMVWMRTPGQSWFGTAAAFLGMWTVMMVVMMLPSLVPMLWRYRRALMGASRVRMEGLTALVGLAYFFVWSVFGALLFPVGATLAMRAMEYPMLARIVPIGVGAVVLMAGMTQFTAWKARHLVCCRELPKRGHGMPANAAAAWRYGLRLGMHCGCSSAGLTAILLVGGVMDLTVTAVVTVAIAAERLAPGGERVARGVGVVAMGAGVFLLVRAMGLG